MVMPISPAIISMEPESKLASMAAVFSITRTIMRLNRGFLPHQVGLGSNTTWEPELTSDIR